jgi:O-antigen/teichoic acid export membrane protein
MSVANGLEKQVKVNYLTIISYLLCIPIVFFLVSNYFMLGGMLSLLLTISVFGITSMIFIFNQKYVDIKIKLNFNKYNLNILFKYTLMLIASALLFPLNEFLMREAILSHSNSTIVGYWQALNKLSGAYIGFFAIILSSIYMPKIASLDNKNSIFTLVKKALLYTGIIFIFTALIILLLKKNIILILFSDKFLLLSDVLSWQFIGDFFRVCSYVIGFITVAKGLFKLYIFGELLQNILYYTSLKITLLQSSFSFENVVKSYSVAYFIYFLIVYIVYYSFIRYSKKVTI